ISARSLTLSYSILPPGAKSLVVAATLILLAVSPAGAAAPIAHPGAETTTQPDNNADKPGDANEGPAIPPMLQRPSEPIVGPIDTKPDPLTDDKGDLQISMYIREVFQDRDGVYWFGTNDDGLARYDGEKLTYVSVKDGLAGSAIRGILQSPDGALWFATNDGVSRYKDGRFTNYTTADGLSHNQVWCIF
ncbi:MAG: hypothetical protein KDA16_14775, partial [Phycisphaerales bacterium]|nr:hypothetical protein [Phycisphaerales bacterium]